MARSLGGQAVVEGVMIKNGATIAVAVRTQPQKIQSVRFSSPIADSTIPFIRGVVNLISQLYVGMKALTISTLLVESKGKIKESEESKPLWIFFAMGISFVLALILFKFVPLFLTQLISRFIPLNRLFFSLLDGVLKLSIFLGYLLFISRMKDVQRLFQYHGAEHMAVHCYEANKPLTTK
ncbi:DUF1385 domain-containing protein, partial [Candidatus Woesearchaeota archaeon]|nr:DUF1385 domain-containing protein [Candidatus Woesearchaeota archaeon]